MHLCIRLRDSLDVKGYLLHQRTGVSTRLSGRKKMCEKVYFRGTCRELVGEKKNQKMEVKRKERLYSCENKSDLGSGHRQSLTELSGGSSESCRWLTSPCGPNLMMIMNWDWKDHRHAIDSNRV